MKAKKALVRPPVLLAVLTLALVALVTYCGLTPASGQAPDGSPPVPTPQPVTGEISVRTVALVPTDDSPREYECKADAVIRRRLDQTVSSWRPPLIAALMVRATR